MENFRMSEKKINKSTQIVFNLVMEANSRNKRRPIVELGSQTFDRGFPNKKKSIATGNKKYWSEGQSVDKTNKSQESIKFQMRAQS